MRAGVLSLRLRVALAWRALLIDLNNFFLMQHRDVGGFLISGKNSGTHWVRHMLSYALAHRHGLAPPIHSSGRDSEDFVGHPRWPRKHPEIPFIASSHTLPSIAFTWAWLRRLLRLPPIVVLVRDPKEAMASHFVKWRGPLQLSLHDYVHRASTRRRQLADAWWYIDFFNRWGRMAACAPDRVLVVRYEDLKARPAIWLERISRHLRLGLTAGDIDAAIGLSTRDAIRERLDPAYGEAIVPDAATREAMRFPPMEDAMLEARFDAFMRYDFGYGYARRIKPSRAGDHAATWRRLGAGRLRGRRRLRGVQPGRPADPEPAAGRALGPGGADRRLFGARRVRPPLLPQAAAGAAGDPFRRRRRGGARPALAAGARRRQRHGSDGRGRRHRRGHGCLAAAPGVGLAGAPAADGQCDVFGGSGGNGAI